MTDKIPNPYLVVLTRVSRRCTDDAHVLESAFDRAKAAMQDGAWLGGASESFFAELVGHANAARRAGVRGIQEFDDGRVGHQEMVAKDHPDARWADYL